MRKSKSNATATASISASTSYKTSSSTTLTSTPPRPLSPLPPPLLHTRLHRERNRAPYMLSDLIATTHRLSETLPSELWESSAVFGLRRDGRSGELQVVSLGLGVAWVGGGKCAIEGEEEEQEQGEEQGEEEEEGEGEGGGQGEEEEGVGRTGMGDGRATRTWAERCVCWIKTRGVALMTWRRVRGVF